MMKNEKANPSWWSSKHANAWERVKDAVARDWDQTKHDFSSRRGHDLNQNVGDTTKQAAGKEYIPARNVPNAKPLKSKAAKKPAPDYRDIEPAVRYGYGAAMQHTAYNDWDAHLESQLRDDWENLDHGRSWEEVKEHVRAGWNRARAAS